MTTITATRHKDAPQRRASIHIGTTHGDKFNVTYIYPGSPNMFGGYYPDKAFNKRHSAEKILDSIKSELFDVHFKDHYCKIQFEAATNTKLTEE